jgi:hypothetical protein
MTPLLSNFEANFIDWADKLIFMNDEYFYNFLLLSFLVFY